MLVVLVTLLDDDYHYYYYYYYSYYCLYCSSYCYCYYYYYYCQTAQARQLAVDTALAHITSLAMTMPRGRNWVRCAAMALNVALASGSSEAACEKDWVDASAAGMGCLKMDELTRLTWEDSQAACKLDGGNLLEWTEAARFEALNDILADKYEATGVNSWWIGGTDGDEEGNWTWAESSEDLPSNFPWGKNQPDRGSNANCLALADDWTGHFFGDDVGCLNPLAHICQKMLPLPTPTPPPPPPCSDSWLDLSAAGMGCLKLDHLTRFDWDKSQNFCGGLGGKLLEWKDSANFGVLDDLLNDFYSKFGVPQWWLGGTDAAEEGTWIWAFSAEELPSNFPWAQGYPKKGRNANCLILETEYPNFKGRDFACTWSLPHICQQLPA